MALRLLLRRNHWKTNKAGILLGSINHRLCHSSPSSTTTGTTLEHNIHVPDTSLTDDDRHASFNPKTQPEIYLEFMADGGSRHHPDAHKDDHMIFLAQFAVFIINDTNTRRDNSKRIEFVRVVSAKSQLVDGLIFCITLEAAYDDDGRITKLYEAEFLKKRNWLTLMSWRELQSPPTTTQSSLDSPMDGIEMKKLLEIRAKDLSAYRLQI